MAESKRICSEVEGYIHDVSAVLPSANGRYFTAVLQQADKNSRIVVFDMQKHNSFQCAERDRSPMKLTGVGLSPSKQNKNCNDVLVNGRTKVAVIRRLSFAFEDNLCMSSPMKSLANIMQDLREYQRVSVKVKILHALDNKQSVVRGQKVRRQSFVVADNEHLILLTVWGPHDVDVGAWYRLDHISVRQFSSMPTLSTTMQSILSKIDDCGPATGFLDSDLQTVVGDIIGAEVKVESFCPKHHLLENVNHSTLMTRCSQCQAFCKTGKITVEVRGHVSIEVDSVQQKYFLDDAQFRDLLSLESVKTLSSDSVAADILLHEKIGVKLWREYVMQVCFVDPYDNNSKAECSDAMQLTGVCESEDFHFQAEGEETE